MKHIVQFFIFIGLIFLSISINSQTNDTGLINEDKIQFGLNPIQIAETSSIYYRIPMGYNLTPLCKTTKIDIGFQNGWNPAYDAFGVFLNITPVDFFDLNMSANLNLYYNSLGYGLISLPNLQVEYDDVSLSKYQTKNSIGCTLNVTPVLKAKIESLIVLDALSITMFLVANQDGQYIFERSQNVPIKSNSFEINNTGYILIEIQKGILVGVTDNHLYIPDSDTHRNVLTAIGIVSIPFNHNLYSFDSAILVGAYVYDKYLQSKFYIAGQVGITLHLAPMIEVE